MSDTIARLYNWVNDKNANIKITASRHDEELDQLIVSLNRKVLIKATAPSSPAEGDTWVDTSTTPPTLKLYDGSNWAVQGPVAKGADVASTGSMTLGTDGTYFDITGTTTITSITAKTAGTIVYLQFDGALTVTDGGNLKLNGDFVTAAESTLMLLCDGTNWYEISRTPDNKVSPASAAEVLTGTEAAKYVAPSTLVSHEGVVKGWCVWSGATTITDSFNVDTGAGLTENAAGDVTIPWNTDFGTANAYGIVGTGYDDGISVPLLVAPYSSSSLAVGSARVKVIRPDTAALLQPELAFCMAIGDR